jgi:FkbM family methyltransferase
MDFSDYVIRHAFTNGYVREPEVRLSRALIRPGDTVVDVGAHVGLWVMGAALRAGREAKVHAFEPAAENFAGLLANVKRNGLDFVHCHLSACGADAGHTRIYTASNGNSGMASLAASDGVDVPQETPVTTLDRFCAEASLGPIDFLKVDVEGAEALVFRGARRVLSSAQAPVVLFEVGTTMAARFGSSCRRVKTLLSDCGYEVFLCRRGKLEPVPLSAEHPQADLFAFKPVHFQKHAWLGASVA